MRTKIIAALLAVLTALGGLNLFKSIKDRLLPPATAQTAEVVEIADKSEKGNSHIRVRLRSQEAVDVRERVRVRVRSQEAVDVRERVRVRENDSRVMIEKRFDVREGQALVIDTEHADVEIETGDVDEAYVRVSLDSNRMESAVERFEEMNFQVEMVGDEVRVISEPLRSNWNWNGRFALDVFVTIPERFNANLTTTHGDVELDDLNGIVLLNTTHGDVSASTIRGAKISLKSTHGDIEADALISDQVSVNTTHADIEVGEVSSQKFLAKTTHSDVIVKYLSSDSDITTSHGDIEITLTDDFSAELNTTHGDVMVLVPSDISADLDLKAPQVRVASGFAFDGNVKKDDVTGRINSGGKLIKARTTHGSVHLKNK